MFNPEVYEYVPTIELRPGDTVRLDVLDDPVVLSDVRVSFHDDIDPTVTLYRMPTNGEYASHFEEHGSDLRATWLAASIGAFPVLRKCVPQTGNLVH